MSDDLENLGRGDRRILAEILDAEAGIAGEYEAPTTELESRLCAILADNLGVEQVGITDDLFAYGGDSTTIMSVVADAAEQGLIVTAEALFENPTVLALATAVVDTAASEDPRHDGSSSEPEPDDLLPVDGVQAHIASASTSDPSTYVTSIACILDGRLDLDRLTGAWARVGECVEALHATFHHLEGRWWQRLGLPRELDVGKEVGADGAGWLDSWRTRRTEFPDLADSLLRIRHMHLDDGTTAVELIHHHLLLDGWSQQLLMGHVEAAYRDPRWSGSDVAGEYEAWLRARDRNQASTRPDGGHLGTAVAHGPLRLVADTPRPARASQTVTLPLAPDAVEGLTTAGRERGVTQASLVTAVWSGIVWQLTGCGPSVEFGTVVSGREGVVGGRALIGMLVETVPLTVDGLRPDVSIGDLAGRIQRLSVTERGRPSRASRLDGGGLDSVVVVQTLPVRYREGGSFAGHRIRALEQRIVETTPLLFEWVPGPSALAAIRHDPRLVDTTLARAVAEAIITILTDLDLRTPISELGQVVADSVDRRALDRQRSLADQLRSWSGPESP